jgi:hypothetical protein
METPNIVLVGHVCVDHNTTEHATYTSWGSSVLYMAKYLQATYFVVPLVISNYGSDIVPYLPVVEMLPEKPNTEQTLIYENDTRTLPRIWRAHNTEYAEAPAITPRVIEALQEADIVVVATLLPNYPPEYVQELLSHVKPSCLRVLCPQGYFRHINEDGLVVPRDFDEAPEIVPMFDLVIYSEEDNPHAFEIAKEWQQTSEGAKVIVTQGPKGASIVGQEGIQHIPTTPLTPEEIVDSVGCGDIFAATAMYAYYQSQDLEAAIRKAHKAAAAKLLAVPVI